MAGNSDDMTGLTEKALIAAIRARARARGSSRLRLGIGDDCAIVRPVADEELVVTTDFSLEGVHFRCEWHSPEAVGHKCLARGLSDVAAMGAKPVAAFLSMAVPQELVEARRGRAWVERFMDGLLALGERYEVPLAGGDTAQSLGPACFDIVVLGSVKRGQAWLRSGAKAGDGIYVTGALGGAAAELLALERGPRKFSGLKQAAEGHPHFFPEPRLAVAAKLAKAGLVGAAIDISDGLSTDLAHICEESGLGAELDAAAVPVHPLALKAECAGLAGAALDLALHGGDDYELLFTARSGAKVPRSVAGIAVTRIGRTVTRRKGRTMMMLRGVDGCVTALEVRGWEHFK